MPLDPFAEGHKIPSSAPTLRIGSPSTYSFFLRLFFIRFARPDQLFLINYIESQ